MRLAILQLASAMSDDAGARRRFVVAFGDALRETGAAAIEGHGLTGGKKTTIDDATRLAGSLMDALEEYFGLSSGSMVDLATSCRRRAVPGAFVPPGGSTLTLALWSEPCEVAIASIAKARHRLSAGPGQLLVLPGEVLARVTNDVVAGWRSDLRVDPPAAQATVFEVRPDGRASIAPHAAFVSQRRQARYPPVVAASLLPS